MSCGKCGCGKKGVRFCPFSFGLALGITLGLFVFLCSVWMMYHGIPASLAALNLEVPTWATSITHGLWGLLKGFIFGLIFALIYNCITCCCRMKCCKNSNGSCSCGCDCCSVPVDKRVP